VAPDTSIESGPSGSITGTSAAFTYAATEGAASFECRLDGGAFGSCPTAGASFNALAVGPHAFAVRATDAAGNVDASPAQREFSVAATPIDCSAQEGAVARAEAKLKKAKKKLKNAHGSRAKAKARKGVKRAKAKLKEARAELATCAG
jgi:hypothetical protein